MIASTAGRDAALYRFSAVNGRVRALWQRVLPPGGTDTLAAVNGRVRALWQRVLPPGGTDTLAAATGGRGLVLGVGGPGTAALFRPADGARLWQGHPPDGGARWRTRGDRRSHRPGSGAVPARRRRVPPLP